MTAEAARVFKAKKKFLPPGPHRTSSALLGATLGGNASRACGVTADTARRETNAGACIAKGRPAPPFGVGPIGARASAAPARPLAWLLHREMAPSAVCAKGSRSATNRATGLRPLWRPQDGAGKKARSSEGECAGGGNHSGNGRDRDWGPSRSEGGARSFSRCRPWNGTGQDRR